MNRRIYILLAIILISGFILRVFNLSENPPSVSWDEISHGYNAYSLLKTGTDEWGKIPILNFRAYGDYPLPLNLYLTIPYVAALGLSTFSIRLPHAILGILTALAAYFLAYALTKSRGISLLTTLLVVLEPWTLFTSRIVLQQNLSIFLLTAGMAAFFNKHKSKFLLPASFILMFLTLFSYHSTRIFSPLLVIVTLFIFRNDFKEKYLRKGLISLIFIVSIIVFFLVSVVILIDPNSRARSKWLFIIDQAAINRIIEKREASTLPYEIARFVYNRPTYFITKFTSNFLGYFSPKFLFFKGGTQYQYNLPGFGLSYLVNLPFFYLGIFLVIKNAIKGSKDYLLILTWLLLSPISGSITNETFAVTRASTMLPLPMLLSAFGLATIWEWMVKGRVTAGMKYWISYHTFKAFAPLAAIIYFTFLGISVYAYLRNYFGNYRLNYSWSWQYGYKEVINYARVNYGKYDKIIVTKKYGEPHEFLLFFWPWDPQQYKNDPNLIRFHQSNWYWVDRFDKFYFVNDWDIPKLEDGLWKMEYGGGFECKKINCMLITSPGNVPMNWNKLETVNYLDGKTAFEIYENK
ncbi:hypothetical protein A3A76_03800 [Candidatus Woesebacteria bacterium RIFCSPLOWO2_01_FULL_39_23]|uniref:ArnT-like N-terminal domain-containing protein n=1 Tax=Candidatus Woesebacteria bacterium RIFCSPHIGHO2_01_FULL_40_22 TaxID=1802499 RepID=A0A1F7YJY3_9BACT|nr:MAG: hypothetical protein A2628_02200 [Candidatus Woesebacteria bacterium RIFCSPHIGHO2_01_FULL_40_22]OGM36731.1 MAG: hypothetical protein A3E41_03045 [Candidatus Woesebacteria bacterium RIFCSPHIGHO2_12_FULL_38_9]OGM62751.1 MAG: hypothetical protein A3A76_03800 [Candidatus Woesebacteria bacterium RIFCSPLOWO2_01_FULL_39_23]